MARIDFGNLMGPVMVGIASAGGDIIAANAADKSTGNAFMQNASLWTDVLVGGYAIANKSMDLGFPRSGADETLGAGVALLAKRASNVVARNLLSLPGAGGARMIPGRARPRLAGRGPASAVESGVIPRKRQFFSVV
jgi:hypothetical protein